MSTSKADKLPEQIIATRTQLHDLMKHMTTLSSGSTVLLATFASNFKEMKLREFLAIGLIGMVTSLLCSLFVMFNTANMKDPFTENQSILVTAAIMLVACSFFVGTVSLAWFAVQNF
jgi:NhaP-type Na+/H+ or K+/H+ antiporter